MSSEIRDRARTKLGDLINSFVNKQSFTGQDLDEILSIPEIARGLELYEKEQENAKVRDMLKAGWVKEEK